MKYAVAVLAGCSAIVAASFAIRAQQNPPEPNRLGQPLLSSPGVVREDAILRMPLRPEDRKYADLDGQRLKSLMREVIAISQKDRAAGRSFWGRNQGTAGHAMTQDWVETYFRKYGLQNIYRQPFDLAPQWTPTAWEITFSAGGKPFTLESARPFPSDSTPPGGVEWELTWAGTGHAADFAGRDVKGKVVLIHDLPLPGDIRHSVSVDRSVARAFEHGAAAVGVIFGLSDNFAIWQGEGRRPGFNVGFQDGRKLLELIGQGQTIRVKYRMTSEMRSGLKTASVWGTLPGTTDEDIIIMAHLDGYFDAALDNASGLAVMIGLLEHFSNTPPADRRRNVRFLGSAGHHAGPGTRWLRDNKDTALAKTTLMINLEHVAAMRTKYWGYQLRKTTAVSPMRWWVWGSPKLLDIALGSFARFNVGITADMDPGASGEMGPIARDAPSIQVITSPEVKHTEQDTEEWVPAVGLEQIARAYARIVDEVNKLDRRDVLPTAAPARSGADRQ
jgi:hypothetical protein